MDILDFKNSIYLVLIVIFCSFKAHAAAPPDLEEQFGPRPLDGVYIEALQSYSNPRSSQWGFDFGVLPNQPYYNGFSVGVNYTYYFNKDHAWEVLNASYVYGVDTGLTVELADRYGVQPETIQRVNLIATSNYLYNFAYGKFIFFGQNIRYFRSYVLGGGGIVSSNQGAFPDVSFGWGFDTFVNDRVSWRISVRDNYAIGGDHPNNIVVTLGTGYGF